MGELVQLQVVSLSPSAAGASSYILFLQADSVNHLGFPMVIGLNEAQAISMFIEEIIPARPLTHDLFANFIQSSGVKVSFIEISNFVDGVFFAKIHYDKDDASFFIDARPSDAIALALRLQVDIKIQDSLLNEIAIPMDAFHSDETELESEESTLESGEDVADLEQSLAKALEDENYEEAAKLRDKLNKLTK